MGEGDSQGRLPEEAPFELKFDMWVKLAGQREAQKMEGVI